MFTFFLMVFFLYCVDKKDILLYLIVKKKTELWVCKLLYWSSATFDLGSMDSAEASKAKGKCNIPVQ